MPPMYRSHSAMMMARSGHHLRSTFLLQLDTPLGLPLLTRLLQLTQIPKIYSHKSSPESRYILIDLAARVLLDEYSRPKNPCTFVALPIPALKDLRGGMELGYIEVPDWPYPTAREPAQNEYPVPYFVYGSLAESDRLMSLLDLDTLPALEDATVMRGKLMKRGDTPRNSIQHPFPTSSNRALVNAAKEDEVQGKMVRVENRQQEAKLLLHMGENYEVVRCRIRNSGARTVTGSTAAGLTFRWCGRSSELKEMEDVEHIL